MLCVTAAARPRRARKSFTRTCTKDLPPRPLAPSWPILASLSCCAPFGAGGMPPPAPAAAAPPSAVGAPPAPPLIAGQYDEQHTGYSLYSSAPQAASLRAQVARAVQSPPEPRAASSLIGEPNTFSGPVPPGKHVVGQARSTLAPTGGVAAFSSTAASPQASAWPFFGSGAPASAVHSESLLQQQQSQQPMSFQLQRGITGPVGGFGGFGTFPDSTARPSAVFASPPPPPPQAPAPVPAPVNGFSFSGPTSLAIAPFGAARPVSFCGASLQSLPPPTANEVLVASAITSASARHVRVLPSVLYSTS